jgi:ankyrin repeat protein
MPSFHYQYSLKTKEKKKKIAGNDAEYVQHEALKMAIESGDWNTAEEFLKRQPDAVAAKITYSGNTALHLAVKAGHEDIVEKLVDLMFKEDLAISSTSGNTALSHALAAGNYRMAACMIRKNNDLLSIQDSNELIPVNEAIGHGNIELARYLYSLTPLEDLMPERGVDGATLCTQAIYNRSLGKNPTLHLKV